MNCNEKSIIIIGAGIAGLAAGIYGQMNGYKTTIFEMNHVPGGLVTSWKRKGYTFDGAMDWFIGTGLNDRSSIVWRELGYLQDRKIDYYDELLHVRDRNGKLWTLYTDPSMLEDQLLQLTDDEEDKEKVKKLCKDIARFIEAAPLDFRKPQTLYEASDYMKFAEEYADCMDIFIEYNQLLVSDYADSFKDHRLREVMTYMFYEPESPHVPFVFIFQLASMYKKTAGYPQGGSLGVSNFLEARYKELGGNIQYRATVKKIITLDGVAKGIILENGTKHFADYVVSACDTRQVIYEMLEGKYVNDAIDKLYTEGVIHASVLKVYLGVDRDFKNEPDVAVHMLNEPLDIPGLNQKRPRTSLVLRHYCNLESSYAPPGKSVMESFFYSGYDYWGDLYNKDRELYKKEKERIASIVIDQIERIYPGTKEKIEVVDVVTPVTYQRYTGNHKGAIMGWMDDTTIVPDLMKQIGATLPGLNNFYMTGQWIVTGGMIRAASSGRYAIERICLKDGVEFKTI
ncbi:NAD(P)/FAD-dependent oxidoreductase [Heliobacterium chlorum]|uniref:NAD(P)/FAD-dependent oxidoreductase n=1 Tax=Heliobacterium chlorum TaxID=2698 RepID=A0ABR7SWZ9_HELCL|nr:NAD(P)/FAD-dependent oxidoreductase [Heliobacterium chlorum]MBC9783077.1 NAD(P)/FAD-dependent oxidoreductase [Heliobacterium chlorum]